MHHNGAKLNDMLFHNGALHGIRDCGGKKKPGAMAGLSRDSAADQTL